MHIHYAGIMYARFTTNISWYSRSQGHKLLSEEQELLHHEHWNESTGMNLHQLKNIKHINSSTHWKRSTAEGMKLLHEDTPTLW